MIKLRPHHVENIRDLIFLEDTKKELSQNPASRDLKRSYEDQRKFLATLLDVYHGTAIPEALNIAREIIANPDRPIQIIEGQDRICESCRFYRNCRSRDYASVIDSYQKCGISLPNEANPETSDEISTKRLDLDKKRIYRSRELFNL